jgi:diaminopimelate epimerase
MKFEKWQALGNDYLIVEAAAVQPDTVIALCDRHKGVGADGVLALAPADEPGYVARLRIYNPDGSEAELSGNGARQALLYLREHGWTSAQTYSIQTVAGEIRTTITGEHTCRMDMGRAIVRFDGEVAGLRFQHLTIGNPQTPIRIATVEETASAPASSSAGWGRRCPPAPARAGPRSPTCCAAATRPSPWCSTAVSSRSTSTSRCTSI